MIAVSIWELSLSSARLIRAVFLHLKSMRAAGHDNTHQSAWLHSLLSEEDTMGCTSSTQTTAQDTTRPNTKQDGSTSSKTIQPKNSHLSYILSNTVDLQGVSWGEWRIPGRLCGIFWSGDIDVIMKTPMNCKMLRRFLSERKIAILVTFRTLGHPNLKLNPQPLCKAPRYLSRKLSSARHAV